MKKSLVILVGLGLIVLLSMSVVSASWFGDFWKKITGRTTEGNETSSTCTDDCSSDGTKQCSGGTGYQTCGNYDSDSCLEWSSATSCSSSETCVGGACVSNTFTCTDSDGGREYNTKGNVVASSPTSSIDVTDLCSDSSKVVEYFCTNLQQSGETYTCPNGCSNGACVSSTTDSTRSTTNQTVSVSCTDSDGGKNYNVQGRTTATSGDITDITEVCSGKYVIEHSCTSNGIIASEYYLCSDGCSNGACISSTTTNQTNTPTATTTPTTTTTTTSVSAGGSSGSGSTSSTKLEISEGVFEEKIIIEEKIEGEIRITTETKEVTDRLGNKIEIEIKTEIREDGTTITEEKREFLNKEGKLVKFKIKFENDGENVKINREIEVEGKKFSSELEIKEEFKGDEVQLTARLSNGDEREIKIMPDRASEIAIEKLETNNFEIELKEVGEGENLQAVYIAKVDENGRLFGLFKVRLKSEAQIDSRTGEILSLEKQWWNFLTTKLNEPKEILANNETGNNTNLTLPPPVNITIKNTNNITNITLPPSNNQTNTSNITLPPPVNQTNISLGNQTGNNTLNTSGF